MRRGGWRGRGKGRLWLAGLLAGAVVVVAARGALVREAPLRPPAVEEARPEPIPVPSAQRRAGHGRGRVVALTFDLGDVKGRTPDVLALLEREKIPATFFLTGRWMEKNPELTRQIAAGGFEIGNHSYSHPDLRRLTPEQVRAQIARPDDVARALLGHPLAHYFRPPYGEFNRTVTETAISLGYRMAFWDIDGGDWNATTTPVSMTERIVRRVHPGTIVLMHGATEDSLRALPALIRDLRAQHYRFVTIDALDHGQRFIGTP